RAGDTIQGFGGGWDGTTNTFPATGIMARAKSQCVFTNQNRRSNWNGGSPVFDYSLILDHDITIRDLFINGNWRNGDINSITYGAGETYYTNWADAYSPTG